MPPAEYVSELFTLHRSFGLVRIVPPASAEKPLDVVRARLINRKVQHCNRQSVRREAGGAAYAITSEPFTYEPLTLDQLALTWAAQEHASDQSEGMVSCSLPQLGSFGSAREMLDAASQESLWEREDDSGGEGCGGEGCGRQEEWTDQDIAQAEEEVWSRLHREEGAEYSSENDCEHLRCRPALTDTADHGAQFRDTRRPRHAISGTSEICTRRYLPCGQSTARSCLVSTRLSHT